MVGRPGGQAAVTRWVQEQGRGGAVVLRVHPWRRRGRYRSSPHHRGTTPDTGARHYDALLAAIAEHITSRYGLPASLWTATTDRFLYRAWWIAALPSARMCVRSKSLPPLADHLLAMKVLAARAIRDADDVRILIRHLGITAAGEVWVIVDRFFPDVPVKQHARGLVEDILGEQNGGNGV